MIKKFLTSGLSIVCLTLAVSTARAQERIYAVSGTVTSINPKIQMTEVNTDDGTTGHFRWLKAGSATVDFNKSVKADTTPAADFAAKGNHVIAYYFGEGDIRTVVAFRDLGPAPTNKNAGEVVKVDRHSHVLTIQKTAGGEASFHLDPKTVVETPTGVMQDFKFDLNKGDKVLVTSSPINGSDTALLIIPAVM